MVINARSKVRITFSMLLLYCAGRMLFRPSGRARAALETSLLVGSFAVTYLVMRLLGRKWRRAPEWGAIYRAKQREPFEYDYEI